MSKVATETKSEKILRVIFDQAVGHFGYPHEPF